jgi:hypothetical protein
MTSLLSSFGLAAWARGLTNTALALMTKHAKARRKKLVDIKNLPLSFIIEPVAGGPPIAADRNVTSKNGLYR